MIDKLLETLKPPPVDEQRLLETAILIAALYHAGQVDKLGQPYVLHLMAVAMMMAPLYHGGQVDKAGQPYVLHLMAVANAPVMTLKQRTCALLHDILEDTRMTVERLRISFPEDYVQTIVALTHVKTESRDEYYARVMADPDAVIIKLADVQHNLSRLRDIEDDATRKRLTHKYEHALEVLMKW